MKDERVVNQETMPDGIIVFISGVPGMGKTTISYELLKKYNKFRIIEETDLIREILRGYNEHLKKEFGNQVDFLFEKIYITDHTKLLTFEEAKFQCKIMKQSFEQIIARQQRKGISTIINGVHIIPEVLSDIAEKNNVIFVNLYVTDEHEIYERIFKRDSTSYMLEHIPFIFHTNTEQYLSTKRISLEFRNVINVDVTRLSVENTMNQIIEHIKNMSP
ncbi:MAG: hypothetical protein PUB52_10110 [Lachnospiraceae bacterium]|nr:hypothetical protein [Lachnospiraceae bacterium]